MKKLALFGLIALALTSCLNEDPGPYQEQKKEYALQGFTELEISDALNVTVLQGNSFSVKAEGDRRNIDDLEVRTYNNTLRMRLVNDSRPNRQYKTYVTITMPVLESIELSGAVTANISGSVDNFYADISGASELYAFDFEAKQATINASGASKIEILATQVLKANASGASKIRYRGNPQLTATASGASFIGAD